MFDTKRWLSLILIVVLVLSLFSGCGIESKLNASNNNHELYKDFLTIDVFSTQANFQGLQSGWFGKIVQDKFNMRLNIIAPNVTGAGDRLYQTRSAAGNLADIVMISSENGKLRETVDAGLLLDMSVYKEQMPHAMAYEEAIASIQNALDVQNAIYAIPSSVSNYPATEPSEGTEPAYGPYLRWDLYTAIGTPQMETLEDLLPVLKKMQMMNPKSDSGQKTYGFSLFSDWDDNLMMFAKQPACFYGYDEVGFVLNKADGSEMFSLIDSDSPYVRALKFYYQANRMGLVDPDSRMQSWDTVWNKYADGAVLFSPWPWLGQPAYNTIERLSAGKGFMMAPIDDLNIFSYGATPQGSKLIVGIGSKAQDPERMAAFIDWLYSPEGIMMSTSQTGSTSGPEGLTWEMVEGRPELTTFGIQAMLDNGTEMPDTWGGGLWGEGTSQLNFQTVLPKDINPANGQPFDFKLWESYQEFTATPVHESWEKHMKASSTLEYLALKAQYVVAPGTDYVAPAESTQINTLRAKSKAIIVDLSWKMVFATTESEFNALLESMQKKVQEVGYAEVLAFDMQTATQLNALRQAIYE